MKSFKNLSIWLGLFLAFLLLNIKYLNEGPISTHIWAQADHYAIALGFVDNDLDFFHPQTFCLNPQFGATKLQGSKEFWTIVPNNPNGITAIDFPIHHYAVACIMKLFDSTEPIIFRLYTLLLSFIGLIFLYKSSRLVNNSKKVSFFILIFAVLSPTYNFYSSNFLPSSLALSTLFIALFYFIEYIKNEKNSRLYYSVLLLTISALVRFPFLIFHIALISTFVFSIIFLKKKFLKEILVVLFGISVVLVYFVYNKFYLAYNYGSNFLGSPLPASNFLDFFDSIYRTMLHAAGRYLTLVHYILIVILFYVFIKNNPLKKSSNLKFASIFLIFQLLGVTSYSFLMVKQFPAHDYYFLDTFFPLIIISLLLFAKHFFKSIKIDNKVFLIGFTVLTLIGNRVIFKYGFNSNNTNDLEWTRRNFIDGDKLLDSIGISKDAKILVLDSNAPNLVFTQIKRKGYCVMDTSFENINRSLNWDFDYIITQNFSLESDIIKNYPSFNSETSILYSNEKFTVHLKK